MKSTAYQFEQWVEVLESFQKNVEKDLKEIRKHKNEVQQIKSDLLDRLNVGTYFRDERRVVISAPEIIIGNVDKNGVMLGGTTSSKIILRANDVAIEGVGLSDENKGRVVTKASCIHNIAVDPGIDGMESVVRETSEIVSQARNVVLQGESAKEFFPLSASVPASYTGVTISADDHIELSAARPCASLKRTLDQQKDDITKSVSDLKSKSNKEKQHIDSLMKSLDKLINEDELNSDEISSRTNYLDIEEIHDNFVSITNSMYESMSSYFNSLSMLAEKNRQISAIQKQLKDVNDLKSSYKTKSTNSSIFIESEMIYMMSKDGDGNIRTNDSSAFSVVAKNINFNANEQDGSLIKDSLINLSSQKLNISTANPKYTKDDSDHPAIGDVRIVSKNILLESVDYEIKNKTIQEKALTKQGSIILRAEDISASSFETDGKATGSISINAKKVEVKSMDVDKEKKTDKSVAVGSSVLLLSEKMFVGARDKKLKSKVLQLSSEKIGAFGDTTVELLQGENKGIVQLDGGDVAVSGSKLALYGNTMAYGKSTFKADVITEKIEVKNIDIKSSFKSPCTTEGIAIPGAPSSAKLSAKMKFDEMPADKKE